MRCTFERKPPGNNKLAYGLERNAALNTNEKRARITQQEVQMKLDSLMYYKILLYAPHYTYVRSFSEHSQILAS